ncbi:hypothetical protein BKA66DRAFT_467545 [Pyrenochaeta sp. MPI-SDFR-AT-0127]|nr:hypothetical protein BKA66DRAFT_467545 [Pyrenochaeta sp. MPI-SDFR-AT-0127]
MEHSLSSFPQERGKDFDSFSFLLRRWVRLCVFVSLDWLLCMMVTSTLVVWAKKVRFPRWLGSFFYCFWASWRGLEGSGFA